MTPSYALGLFFIFLVSMIWAAASIVVQHLYRDMEFDSPFLLTYVSTSLFILFLPTRLIWERRRKIIRRICCGSLSWTSKQSPVYSALGNDSDDSGENGWNEEDELIIPWRNRCEDAVLVQEGNLQVESTTSGQGSHSSSENLEMTNEDIASGEGTAACRPTEFSVRCEGDIANTDKSVEEGKGTAESSDSCLRKSSRGDDRTESSNSTRQSPLHSDKREGSCAADESETESSLHTAETLASTLSEQTGHCLHPSAATSHLLSHVDHIYMALRIGPVWFLSNYFYNTSLAYTSISSSTVLASTGSLFTFLFAVVFGDERASWSKSAGVMLCFAGSILTGLSDAEAAGHDEGADFSNATLFGQPTASLEHDVTVDSTSFSSMDNHDRLQLLGDLAGLISAIGYGTYTVLIRSLCPKDESKMSMQLLLGYIGALNGLSLLPVAIKMVFFDSCSDSDGKYSTSSSPAEDSDADSVETGNDLFGHTSPCERITLVVLAYLLGKAFFDNVLSDYLWARAVVLTSATVATVGLGLTIPLAFLSDWFMGHDDVISLPSVAGATAVLLGFIFVNCGETGNGEEDAE